MTDKKQSRGEMSFDEALKRFRKTNAQAQALALMCSTMALKHFYKCGDLVYCQQFLDAMVQNWNRRVAFFRWLQAHAPIIQAAGVLEKDKTPEAVKMSEELLNKALETPFWDFSPEPGLKEYDIMDIDQSIRNALNKFKGDGFKAKTERTMTYLTELEEKLNSEVLMTAPKAAKERKAAPVPAT